MNRRLLFSGIVLVCTANLSLSAKGKKKKKGKKNEKPSEAGKGELSGIFVLKRKKNDSEPDDYLFLSRNMAYTISRASYNEVEGNLEREVTIECKVVRGDRIVAIRKMY